jgi:hypothetical protein
MTITKYDEGNQGSLRQEISFILQTIPIPRKAIAYQLNINFSTYNKYCTGILPLPLIYFKPLYDLTGDKRLLKYCPDNEDDEGSHEVMLEALTSIVAETGKVAEDILEARSPGNRHMTNLELKSLIKSAQKTQKKWESFAEYLNKKKEG